METRESENKTRIRQDGNKIKGNPKLKRTQKRKRKRTWTQAVAVGSDTEVWSVEKDWSVSQLGYVEGAICRGKIEDGEDEDWMRVKTIVQPSRERVFLCFRRRCVSLKRRASAEIFRTLRRHMPFVNIT
jgi:hypothetical protein